MTSWGSSNPESPASGWGAGGLRTLARMARRSVMRNRLRSLLIVLLLAVPVAVAVGFSTVQRTNTVRPAEQVTSFYGGADFLFTSSSNIMRPSSYDVQAADIDKLVDELTALPGASVMTNRFTIDWLNVTPYISSSPINTVTVSDVDLTNPMSEGLLLVLEGSVPRAGDEVLLTREFAKRKGVELGDTMVMSNNRFTVSGIGVVPTDRNHLGMIVVPASFDLLANGDQNVEHHIRVTLESSVAGRGELLRLGIDTLGPDLQWTVQDAAQDPRLSAGPINPEARPEQMSTLLAGLVGIEIALIAAAAFAVSTRRRVREFGQLLATGADGAHIRNLLLLEAGLLALVGVIVGMALGLLGASVVVAQEWIPASRWAPTLQWTPIDVIGPAFVALGAALLAAWWPASEASSVPITSALAGRLPTRTPRHRTPLVGMTTLGIGALALFSLLGANPYLGSSGNRTVFGVLIVASIGAMFFGTLSVVGHMLHLASRGSTRFAERVPLAVRLITRNSARHRGRSGAAVAAFVAVAAIPVVFGSATAAYPTEAGSDDGRMVAIGDLGPNYGGVGISQTDVPILPEVAFPVGSPEFVPPSVSSSPFGSTSAVPAAPEEAILAQESELARLLTDATRATLPQASEHLVSVVSDPDLRVTLIEANGFSMWGVSVTATVATPTFMEALNLSREHRERLGAGHAVVFGNPGRSLNYSRHAERPDLNYSFAITEQGASDVISAPVTFAPDNGLGFMNVVLISPELAAAHDLALVDVPVFLNPDNLTPTQIEQLERRAAAAWTGLAPVAGLEPVDLVRPLPSTGPTGAQLRWWSVAAVSALAILISLIVASLAAVEADKDFASMIATGASPSIRRWMLGAQTTYHMVLAALLGIPLAIAIFAVILAADDFTARRLVIPWTEIVLMGVAIPVAVGLLVALFFRSGTPAPSRRLT